MKRVLVQVNSLQLGGTQLNAVDLALAVREHGFESIIFGPKLSIPKEGPSLIDVAHDRGLEVHTYPVKPSVLAGGAREFAQRAARVAPDLIHVYGAWGGERAAYWGPCIIARRPLVQTVYEMTVSPQMYRHTTLIVGTGYLLEESRDRPGITRLISPPVDLSRDSSEVTDIEKFLVSIGSKTDKVRVALVSRLDERMKALSVEAAIDAVAALNDPRVELIVAGTGDAFPRLSRLADTQNRAMGRSAIRLLGSMADPRPVYASAAVVLGMGGSAARALAFGRPLIVQGEFGTSEIFTEESAASLYHRSFWNDKSNDDPVDQLVGHLRSVLSDSRTPNIGAFGRKFAERNFGLAAMAERLAETYEVAVANYTGGSWLGDLGLEWRALTRRPPFDSSEPRFWARSRENKSSVESRV